VNGPRDPSVEIRRAGPEDAASVAGVYLSAFHATYDFPLAHTDEQVRAWIRDILLPSGECWVATVGGRVVGMLVVRPGDLDQLYVAPGFQGRGVGSRLVELAKRESPDGLGLYTFQVNARARAFYERRGFVADRFGDGSGNEEGQPDVHYDWRPGPSPTPEPSRDEPEDLR
jgi:ribosomal protein S18 acetylase RimI-like enzyme